MKRLLLILLAAALSAGSAQADTWVVVPSSAPVLPAATPSSNALVLPEALSSQPANPQSLTPEELRPIWQSAADAYGIPWQVLAAINKVESDFGQNMGPSSAGAIGWMQFMPGTWTEYGTDANGDGVADPWNAEDAIYSAARYLAASGGQTDLRQAIFAYNHADWYVEEVLQLAAAYGSGGGELASSLEALHVSLDQAQQDVVDAKAAVRAGQERVGKLASAERSLLLDAADGELLDDRLQAAQEAGQAGVELALARADVGDLRATLRQAEKALRSAQESTAGAAFAPGSSYLLGAPVVQGSFVFPVGGGPELVSVGHDHHDYPAADIAAPAGSPVYALADGQVLQASADPSGNCGIGMTLQTSDGRQWTYCHLAYLVPAVTVGASLPAGANVGLVGQTGHATGPHLHLQLEPATAYPQNEAWFSGFAGRAFRWQEATSLDSAAAPVFAVVAAG
jgi:murein DD-endopeptidase MepM/ murein hydrolase activator NlpD